MYEYIDVKEFRDLGFLQEVNRQFFHPLGLALEIGEKEDGSWELIGIIDARSQAGGLFFHSLPEKEVMEKRNNIAVFDTFKVKERIKKHGYIVQSLDLMSATEGENCLG